MTSAAALLVLAAPLTPLLLMAIWPLAGRARSQLLSWAPLPALAAALLLPDTTALALPTLLLGDASWSLAEPARPLLGAVALVWLAAGHYARGYLADSPRRGRFELLWLAALSGNLGLVVAVDIASFYTFFGLMTFAAYGLVVHDGSVAAQRAGKIYLIMALIGEVLLLAGLLLAAGQLPQPLLTEIPQLLVDGNHRQLITLLLIAGFGVKAGLPLLHMWLPLAHPAAPTPASAVLSGAMIKGGLLGWLRVLPLGLAAAPEWSLDWGWAIATLGVVAALGAALIGITQRHPKAVLAYSSISQMGMMTMLIGAALLLPTAAAALVTATLLFAVHHGLVKGALFLSIGIAQRRKPSPWLWLGLAVPALILAGAPFTSGALVKLLAKSSLYQDPLPLLGTLLSVGSVGTTLLMARFLFCLAREPQTGAVQTDTSPTGTLQTSTGQTGTWQTSTLQTDTLPSGTVPAAMWQGWLLLVIAAVTAPLWLGSVSEGELSLDFSVAALWQTSWPLLVGLALAAAALRWRPPYPRIPPGDLLALLSWGRRLQPLALAAGKSLRWWRGRCADSADRVVSGVYRLVAGWLQQERALASVAGFSFVVLTVALVVLLTAGG